MGDYCKEHSLEEMIDVKNRKCEKCKKQPSFNYEGEITSRFCSEHALEGMVDIKSRRCDMCRKGPNFNYKGETQGRFCGDHLLEGMVDVKNRKCEKCKKQPSFNYPGESRARFCGDHFLEGMVDVKHRYCEHVGCDVRPVFNYEGESQGCFCEKHKSEGMIDVESKRCSYPECKTRPSFNYKGESEALFCDIHSLKNMIDIVHKKCKTPGCPTQPTFNFPGKFRGIFCKKCSFEGMVDVVNKKCTKKPCNTSAMYGLLFSPLTRCGQHKTLNMVPAKKRFPICEECYTKSAYYAPPSTTYPTHCEDHAPRDYNNIVEKPCASCGLSFFIPEDQEMCQDCREFSNPIIRHSKELRIKTVLETNNIPITTHDKVPKYFCSKKKPDFIIDCDYFFLIVEVDENQHRSYACDCEVGRMIQLHQDFGGTPVIFIRYNPDGYTDQLGKKHKGRNQNPQREKRLVDLIQKIRKKTRVFADPSVYYLYYDGEDGINKMIVMEYYNSSTKELVDDPKKISSSRRR
jgi:hypothetical protein